MRITMLIVSYPVGLSDINISVIIQKFELVSIPMYSYTLVVNH